jgi:hypothetical protein
MKWWADWLADNPRDHARCPGLTHVGGTFEKGYYEPCWKTVNYLTLATPRGEVSRLALLSLAVAFASLEQRTWKRRER